VLQGAGRDGAENNVTYGNLVFHQDQPHINLFVFFSVFFSCFFLFLAVCVLIWKSKQAVDVHRTRHRQRMQMQHMASRPFGKVLALLDPSTTPLIYPSSSKSVDDVEEEVGATGGEDDVVVGTVATLSTTTRLDPVPEPAAPVELPDERPISPTIIITKVRNSRGGTRGSRRTFKDGGATSPTSITSLSSVASSAAAPPPPPPPAFHVSPITLEPMDDGVAMIGTVLMQLPGGTSAPMQMALGSSLISMRVFYPNPGAGNPGVGAGACRGDGAQHGGKTATIHHRGSSTA
jgi:hypothetical protein